MKIYLVGYGEYAGGDLTYICMSYETALKRYVEVKEKLIKKYIDQIEFSRRENEDMEWWIKDLEKRISILKKLKPNDQNNELFGGYPYIREREAEL